MTQIEKNQADIEFIAEAVIKSLRRPIEEWKILLAQTPREAFHKMPHPTGGDIIIGRDADARFAAIARRFLDSQSDRNTRLEDFVDRLKAAFSQRFMTEGVTLDQRNIQRFISRAHRTCLQKHEPLKHYIPCQIFAGPEQKSFDIGPVHFVPSLKFHREHLNDLEAYMERSKTRNLERMRREAAITGKSVDDPLFAEAAEKWTSYIVGGMQKSFERFEWFAILTIPACDRVISYKKAVLTTRLGLTTLALQLGPSHSDRFRTGDEQDLHSASAQVARNEQGELSIVVKHGGFGNVIGGDWYSSLNEYAKESLNRSGKALALFIASSPPPLVLRYLDAVGWYGDGLVEISAASKLLKFVSAIERIVGTEIETDETGVERKVTGIVATRAAILAKQFDHRSMDDVIGTVKGIYKWRSDLTHGSASPFDPEVLLRSRMAERLARRVIRAGLDLFVRLGLDDRSFTAKRMAQIYRELETTRQATAAARKMTWGGQELEERTT